MRQLEQHSILVRLLRLPEVAEAAIHLRVELVAGVHDVSRCHLSLHLGRHWVEYRLLKGLLLLRWREVLGHAHCLHLRSQELGSLGLATVILWHILLLLLLSQYLLVLLLDVKLLELEHLKLLLGVQGQPPGQLLDLVEVVVFLELEAGHQVGVQGVHARADGGCLLLTVLLLMLDTLSILNGPMRLQSVV